MQKAAFSLFNYQFPKVLLDLSNHNTVDLEVEFTPKGEFDSKNSDFILSFDVKLSSIDSKDKPFVDIQCKGIFKFESLITFAEIPEYFYVNGIAILFPYIRAYLSLVTTQAQVPGIILPTLNLSHLETELRQNTTQK